MSTCIGASIDPVTCEKATTNTIASVAAMDEPRARLPRAVSATRSVQSPTLATANPNVIRKLIVASREFGSKPTSWSVRVQYYTDRLVCQVDIMANRDHHHVGT